MVIKYREQSEEKMQSSKTEKVQFTFSDTVAGYVTSVDKGKKTFTLKTAANKEFQVKLTNTTYAELLRNLGEPFQDPGVALEDLLAAGRYLFACGIFYPEKGELRFEAKHIILAGRNSDEYRFEKPDWWVQQIRALADFYFNAQFPDGVVDYRNYRTHLTLEGQKIESTRQETDTISRMIYGFASAYLLTGEDRYLEAAEKGTEYLREHMRGINEDESVVYWYHAMDVRGDKERKILASQFGDDYDAIPAYEQIYALAGPVQTYRVTGDPRILRDAEMTISLFDKFFLDRKKGGYFSHIDPVKFDPRAESLGQDRARKNWNSVGDHAPAYLINLWLATGEKKYADFLAYTADMIVEHFQDYEHSPFVQERFFEDWSKDQTWGWQQNRAVVGHNLKIAWNLMRIHHLRPNERYTAMARKIAEIMPTVGMDMQRGGWYDVMEREHGKDEEWHRFVWHDRKAWWQQEQAILAYLILNGSLKAPEYLRLARESTAFYNAFFPDQDNGGVYFNVLASGTPFLTGTERLKGSHSMSGYHSFELCYLAATYTNLLIKKQPMDFYFKPQPGALKDNILRVQPDILPEGSVRIESVWINGDPYSEFDPLAMTVKLPPMRKEHPLSQRPGWTGNPALGSASERELKVRVRLVPTGTLSDTSLDITNGVAQLALYGNLNNEAEPAFKKQLDKVVSAHPRRVILRAENLQAISKTSARALGFACQKLDLDEEIYLVGANAGVKETLRSVDILEEFTAVDAFESIGRA
jgi:mannose/cellobiose epimerase-like protein (N-acyl-D-glucosamine 2-epimerase family)/anti-anti-sigma regulatory factor